MLQFIYWKDNLKKVHIFVNSDGTVNRYKNGVLHGFNASEYGYEYGYGYDMLYTICYLLIVFFALNTF